MQLQTTSPESKFPNEYSDAIFIQIDQHLKKLLQKYKGVPILWIMVYMCCEFKLQHQLLAQAKNSQLANCKFAKLQPAKKFQLSYVKAIFIISQSKIIKQPA